MELKEPELKNILQKFDNMIMEVPDEKRSIPEFKQFITTFLRTKTKEVTLPVADVMAIMKKKKPFVFAAIRNQYSHNVMFNVVTHIDVDYYEAYKRLNDLKQKLCIIKKY